MSSLKTKHDMTIARMRSVCITLVLTATAVLPGPTAGTEQEGNYHPDAIAYASATGVSLDVADWRLEMQPELAGLRTRLESDERTTFAGLYIDHQPTYRIVALFTRDGAETIKRYLTSGPLLDLIFVQEAQHSLAELEADLETLAASLVDREITLDIDLPGNTVVVETTSLEVATLALADARLTLPSSAQIRVVSELPEPDLNLYGGLWLSSCTSGFTVWKNDTSNRMITTAGHCDNSQSYGGLALTYQNDEKRDLGHDEQSHKRAGASYLNLIRIADSGEVTRSITSTRARSSQNVGDFVCKYGMVTRAGCGWIVSKNAGTCGGFNPPAYTGIKVDSDPDGTGFDLSSPGDSGMPWYSGHTALGGHSCGQGYDAIYVPIDIIESGLGASVLTF